MATRLFKKRTLSQFRRLGSLTLAVYCSLNLIDEHSNPIVQPSDSAKGKHQLEMTGVVNFDSYLLGDTPARTAGTVAIRASVLAEYSFNQMAEPCEDYELWLRILADKPQGSFYGIPDRLTDYRIRDSQLTSDATSVFETLDSMYAKFVPQMQDPSSRWIIYEQAGSAARRRGQPAYAEHFWALGRRLSENPDAPIHTLHEPKL